MAVLVEAISVVIRRETLAEKYPGGMDQYIQDCPNGSLCMDDDIVQVGFMYSDDAHAFIGNLESLGFRCRKEEGFDEIAVVDQFEGITLSCDWLECLNVKIFEGDQRMSVCQIKGSKFTGIGFPRGWSYETSLSKHTMTMDSESMEKRMIFLRRKDGIEIHLDVLTGKEWFIERTARRNCNA
jgi:hypothetical protein